ncbi:MAG TPA: outer membrane lipoprotein carrier protein LolA [Candidatus Acidoferrum sp.]|nr:outer membrane lipoprotein carrier protein LolA [Candidatus Acidoferrum sp.]
MSGYLLTLALLFLALTGSTDTKESVARLEARYRVSKTLQATFLERYIENGRVVRIEAGIAYFRRPGKMRWEYESPEKNLFVVDGKSAWFYVPADHTVTRVPAKESTDWRTPLALLAGEMKVSRVCARIGLAINEKLESSDHVVLSCELRGAGAEAHKQGSQEPPLQIGDAGEAVFFEIVKKTGELVRVTVKNPGGVGIEFHFTNWQADPPVDESFFRFIAPPGVAIVNGELPAGNSGINP